MAPLTSFLQYLQSAENPHPSDAGSSVMCWVHGEEIVESSMPALVHEGRRLLSVDTAVPEPSITTDHHGRSGTIGGSRSFFQFLQLQGANVRHTQNEGEHCHMRMISRQLVAPKAAASRPPIHHGSKKL